jgi:O-antigen/teichoic acid export membrane protein
LPNKQVNLTGGRRLARNVLWNLLGNGMPLLVAIVAIPVLIEELGTERFGVLTLAWMVVGYFSLFDLGLGRALTKLVAERLGKGRNTEIAALIWTAMSLMGMLGVLGAVFVAGLSPWLVRSVLQIPSDLQSETLIAFYLLAASIPVVISSVGLRGILEAHQRFGLVNAVRVPLGILTFLGPIAVLPFSNSLVPLVAVLVITRLISWCVYAFACSIVEPALRHSVDIRRVHVMPLISFGGWMTVSNIIGPLMTYMDRFLIGATVSMTAVAYYATPYDVVTKLWIIPGALMGVVFPAFAAALVQDRKHAARLFGKAVSYIFLSLFPIALTIITLANEGVSLWLGSEFANNSFMVLQLLTIGVFINSHSKVPFGLVQSAGRPDLTAKLHILELPFYLLILWWLVDVYGIVGAAIAWVIRVAVDTAVLFALAQRLVPEISPFAPRPVLIGGAALLTLALAPVIPVLAMKAWYLAFVLFVFTWAAWSVLITTIERSMIRKRFRKVISFVSG